MVNLNKIQRKFKGANILVKIGIVSLMLMFVFMIFYSFTNLVPYSIVNIEGNTKYTGGEKQTFKILLTTQSPETYTTPTHYREQYGRWRIVDDTEKVISSGTISKISGGIYNTQIALLVPNVQGTKMVAEIIEYQFSKSEIGGEGEVLRDEGTIKDSTSTDLTLKTCVATTDCQTDKLCSGKTYSCDNGICVSTGVCDACSKDTPCKNYYQCENKECYKVPETNIVEEFIQDYPDPILKTGDTVEDLPAPKTAPKWLILSVFIMTGVTIYLFILLRKRKGKR